MPDRPYRRNCNRAGVEDSSTLNENRMIIAGEVPPQQVGIIAISASSAGRYRSVNKITGNDKCPKMQLQQPEIMHGGGPSSQSRLALYSHREAGKCESGRATLPLALGNGRH